MRSPYLTKSRFKLALECMTKLYYTGKKNEYADQNLDDPFLKALADGGFQVGEYAKYLFCDDPVAEGITIDTLAYEDALKQTQEKLMQPGKVVIAEAAFRTGHLFIRTDILVKNGNIIDLYEVKAKSFQGEDDYTDIKGMVTFAGSDKERVGADWEGYVYDLAFQKYVMTKALPGFQIRAHLLLVNNSARTSIDGLNQYFKLINVDGRSRVEISKPGLKAADLGDPVMKPLNLDELIDKVWNVYPVPTDYSTNITFPEFVKACEEIYTQGRQVFTPLGKKCKECSFKTKAGQDHLKSGFDECWKHNTQYSDELLKKPLVIELWGGAAGGKSLVQEQLDKRVYLLEHVNEQQFLNAVEPDSILPGERRALQILKAREGASTYELRANGLAQEMSTWSWPLHMIDFETSMVPLPFHRGQQPYSGIAFQFSHHTLHKDGTVKHEHQYLAFDRGVFPNFEFVKQLKQALAAEGSVFRYHRHENNYLTYIKNQLEAGQGELAEQERNELINFIASIIVGGKRAMIDLHALTSQYYYSPRMKGSISLKQVLPAIIADSPFLQDKYSRGGVYGKNKMVHSLNFDDHVWIRPDKANDPYKTLPRVFEEWDPETLDELMVNMDHLADGGAAMTAYNYLQYAHLPDVQREKIKDALYRYCELDTLAMVMLVEGWRGMVE